MSRRNSSFQKSIRREQRENEKLRSEFIKDISTENVVIDGKDYRMKNRRERRGAATSR